MVHRTKFENVYLKFSEKIKMIFKVGIVYLAKRALKEPGIIKYSIMRPLSRKN
jgi:hypothetical protein